MACISPVSVYHNGVTYKVPCRHCMSCRIARTSDLTFLCQKEVLDCYSRGLGCSFVTLTYSDINVPVTKDGRLTLRKRDLQLFNKRLRFFLPKGLKYKFVACGEFGDKFGRPHYHIIFFGLSDNIINSCIKKIWTYGLIDVGALNRGGIRYVLKYLTKSSLTPVEKAMYNSLGIECPFLIRSQHIGYNFLCQNAENIVSSKFLYFDGKRYRPYSKSSCKLVSQLTGVDYRPFLAQYFNDSVIRSAPAGVYIPDYVSEQNLLREKQLRANARADGLTVEHESAVSNSWDVRKKSDLSDILSQL